MWRIVAALAGALAAAQAQSVIDGARLPEPYRNFAPAPGEQTLRCEVQPMRPALNFGFRFQTGYVVRVPLAQFPGKGHRWAMLLRVTPQTEGARPVYMAAAVNLPEVPPRTKVDGEVGGAFLVGEGKYTVDWLLADGKGRVCRKSWKAEARLKFSERQVRAAMPPHTVSELSLRGAPQAPRADDVRRLRLSVLLHAAPVYPRRTRMRASDRVLLLGTLSALLEQISSGPIRLGVFNLDQQKELWRSDAFTTADFDRVAQSMNEVELGTVDYKVLRNRAGHLELLAGLVNREMERERPADAVVVLGPPARYWEKMPRDAVERPAADGPGFFNFQLQPYLRATMQFPDVIAYTTSRLKGKTLVIRTPADFARAIAQLRSRAAARE